MDGITEGEEWIDYVDCYNLYLAQEGLNKIDREQNEKARGAIDAFWRALAADKISEKEAAEWARIIAVRVVSTVIDQKEITNERPGNALKALGLFGTEDTNWAEQNCLELYLRFKIISADDAASPTKAQSRDQILEYMRGNGFYADLTPRNAKARIDRLIKKITPSL
jgi:hypothetical protein